MTIGSPNSGIDNDLITGSIFFMLSLFLGFLFQLLSDILFKKQLQKNLTNQFKQGVGKTKEEGEARQTNYGEAKTLLKRINKNSDHKKALDVFYFMHNYL